MFNRLTVVAVVVGVTGLLATGSPASAQLLDFDRIGPTVPIECSPGQDDVVALVLGLDADLVAPELTSIELSSNGSTLHCGMHVESVRVMLDADMDFNLSGADQQIGILQGGDVDIDEDDEDFTLEVLLDEGGDMDLDVPEFPEPYGVQLLIVINFGPDAPIGDSMTIRMTNNLTFVAAAPPPVTGLPISSVAMTFVEDDPPPPPPPDATDLNISFVNAADGEVDAGADDFVVGIVDMAAVSDDSQIVTVDSFSIAAVLTTGLEDIDVEKVRLGLDYDRDGVWEPDELDEELSLTGFAVDDGSITFDLGAGVQIPTGGSKRFLVMYTFSPIALNGTTFGFIIDAGQVNSDATGTVNGLPATSGTFAIVNGTPNPEQDPPPVPQGLSCGATGLPGPLAAWPLLLLGLVLLRLRQSDPA